MTSSSEPVLNIAPITFSSARMQIGRLPELDAGSYQQTREDHWNTHVFRYDSRFGEVLNLSIQPGVPPLGTAEGVDIDQYLLLAARAIQHSILVWLAGKLPILKDTKRLLFWGQADRALLLTQAAQKTGLTPVDGLEVALRYEIDCRMFRYHDDRLYLGLVIDLSTSNIVDISVLTLHEMGLVLTNRYVCRHQEQEREYLRPRLHLLGRVSKVQGGTLWLTDTEGTDRIDAEDAYLEPRLENLRDVVELCYGPSASRVLSELDRLRRPIITANGKLAYVRSTLDALRHQEIALSDGVSVQFGDLLTPQDARFPNTITTERPILLFGAQGRKRHRLPDLGISSFGPYMYMQHARNESVIAVVCEARFRGQVERFAGQMKDGFPNELWHGHTPNPFPDGLLGKYRLSRIRFEYEECTDASATAYRGAALRLLRRLPRSPDLALIQIREDFVGSHGDDNPYLVTKAAFMMAGVPTQGIHIENINLPRTSLPYLLNNISLATYAKLDGTPWVIATPSPTTHELVIGLSATEVSTGRLDQKTRYIGITSVFQGDGHYLVWGATREVEFEEYTGALLEMLRAAIQYVQQHNVWQIGDRVRIVCHAYKRLRDCEVEAIKALVNQLVAERFRVEYAFLDISWWHPYYIFAPSEPGVLYRGNRRKGAGVPRRGLCYQLDRWRGLLHLTGPGEMKTDEQGIPQPLLVELHPDSDFVDMTYLLRQIRHFSYMSWRSFFPGSEPVTLTYSRLIARLLGNLKAVSGWESQVLIGNLRDRKWFL